MQFTFTGDQRLFAATVRDLLERECTAAHVRAAWASETGRSPERWRQLATMGVLGLAAPEAAGGLGLGEVDLVLLLEEAGRAALPEPMLETAAVGVPLLASVAGSADARIGEWLTGVTRGDTILTVGLSSQPYVADAHTADVFLLERGGSIFAVPAGEVATCVAQPSVDRARRLFRVDWVPGRASVAMLEGEAAQAAAALAFDRGALAAAAQLLGISDRLIDITAAYARERQQFGQPIGSFQAIKHHLADALLGLELARPVVYRAAWTVANHGPGRAVDVSMAKAYATDAADRAARVALQVHGAIGYTWECDVQLWMKRAWALGAAWGDAAWHRRRIAAAVIDVGAIDGPVFDGSAGPPVTGGSG